MHTLLSVQTLLQALQHNPLAAAVRGESASTVWLFPIIETCHVVAIAVVFGSIAMVDLRLLGVAERNSAVSTLSREILPYTWTAFALAVVFGTLMFISRADQYIHNRQFQLKFVFMALAGMNMLVFHFGAYRKVLDWDRRLPPPAAARVAGALSLALWIVVIFMGRWTGFTLA